MTTAFKTIMDAAYAAVTSGTPGWGARVYVGRDLDTALDAGSDLTIALEQPTGLQFAIQSGPRDWQVSLAFALRVRGTSSVNAFAAADPMLEDLYQRLDTITWPAGVMGTDDIRCRFSAAEAQTPVAEWQLLLGLQFRTVAGALTLAA